MGFLSFFLAARLLLEAADLGLQVLDVLRRRDGLRPVLQVPSQHVASHPRRLRARRPQVQLLPLLRRRRQLAARLVSAIACREQCQECVDNLSGACQEQHEPSCARCRRQLAARLIGAVACRKRVSNNVTRVSSMA